MKTKLSLTISAVVDAYAFCDLQIDGEPTTEAVQAAVIEWLEAKGIDGVRWHADLESERTGPIKVTGFSETAEQKAKRGFGEVGPLSFSYIED